MGRCASQTQPMISVQNQRHLRQELSNWTDALQRFSKQVRKYRGLCRIRSFPLCTPYAGLYRVQGKKRERFNAASYSEDVSSRRDSEKIAGLYGALLDFGRIDFHSVSVGTVVHASHALMLSNLFIYCL